MRISNKECIMIERIIISIKVTKKQVYKLVLRDGGF